VIFAMAGGDAPLRVRERESGGVVEDGGRESEKWAAIAWPFSWERGISARAVLHFAFYEKEQIISRSKRHLCEFPHS
jgi:hypothetical protein